jgi:ABC-type multidrug transport system ATPase subunit
MCMNSKAVLDIQGLVKDYGAARAVNEISFSVNTGEIVGLLGPNGAGKTTICVIFL